MGSFPSVRGSTLVVSVAEREKNSGRIAKIVLVVGPSKGIAESGEEVINLGRANCNMLADRDVHATAKVHRERFGCGRFGVSVTVQSSDSIQQNASVPQSTDA